MRTKKSFLRHKYPTKKGFENNWVEYVLKYLEFFQGVINGESFSRVVGSMLKIILVSHAMCRSVLVGKPKKPKPEKFEAY